MDFISNLPQNIKENILTYLPLKEAGRTSVLSSAWKYTWTSIPELKIRDFEFPISTTTEKIIDAILLQHSGPILKFDLKTRDHCSLDAFDRWISTVLSNGIKELKLDFNFNRPEYTIHSSLFSCDKLTSLVLKCCSLKLPVGFEGFKFLRSLHFENVTISSDCIKNLVSSCPVLESLKLFNNTGYTVLDIQAPNLKILDVWCFHEPFYLNAPNLLTLTVNLHFPSKNINPEQFLRGSNLESLDLGRHVMKCLANSHDNLHDIVMFPVIFHNLKNLSIEFEDEEEATCVLSLLECAPNLEILNTLIYFNSKLWKSMNGNFFALKRLRYVNVYFNCEIEAVFLFAKFVLESAPQLVELAIESSKDIEVLIKHLLKIQRASTKARITLKSYGLIL